MMTQTSRAPITIWSNALGKIAFTNGAQLAASAVLRGSVRLVASVATRLRRFAAADMVPHDHAQWWKIRQTVRRRFALRTQGRRFRRDPQAYLEQLEADYFKLALPS